MKIRPTDGSSGIPSEPEEIKNNKTDAPQAGEIQEQETQSVRKKEVFSQESLDSLRGVTDTADLGKRFIGMASQGYENSIASADLERVHTMLEDQIGEDPFLQSKLERIAGLLDKTR